MHTRADAILYRPDQAMQWSDQHTGEGRGGEGRGGLWRGGVNEYRQVQEVVQSVIQDSEWGRVKEKGTGEENRRKHRKRL